MILKKETIKEKVSICYHQITTTMKIFYHKNHATITKNQMLEPQQLFVKTYNTPNIFPKLYKQCLKNTLKEYIIKKAPIHPWHPFNCQISTHHKVIVNWPHLRTNQTKTNKETKL